MGTEGSTVLEPLWQGLPPLDSGALSSSASCALPSHYEAVKTAREFTRATLGGWELCDHFDNVTLVVSELVTNALRHGLPTATTPELDPPVRLHLMRWSARLVCAVRDPSRKAPLSADADGEGGAGAIAELIDLSDYTAESGRGLFLVESFSDSWGWQPLDGALPGKVVWALFRLGPISPA
ncbi:ATP-binding protein [Streptomyces gobiensis]|uniref:ATP-binding protein n=1 Tax=Streptomyces gobiensis TaxID=2875706 RepID=UPI001E39010F|nr:ATP-binding protein [Streptomyces gobiensis]UGY92243.1 ATP-binding protein [Streptomyces gobiensis]